MEQSVFYAGEKQFISDCEDNINLLGSRCLPSSRGSPSGNADADNSWSFRGCIGAGIDHFRFDFVRLATARLGKGDAKGRQLPLRVGTFGFMTLFF